MVSSSKGSQSELGHDNAKREEFRPASAARATFSRDQTYRLSAYSRLAVMPFVDTQKNARLAIVAARHSLRLLHSKCDNRHISLRRF